MEMTSPLPRSALLKAFRRGDIRAIEAYLAQDQVLHEIAVTEAFIAENARDTLALRVLGTHLPWYFAPSNYGGVTFIPTVAVDNQHLHVVAWLFSAEREARIPATLVTFTKRMTLRAMETKSIEILEFLLESSVLKHRVAETDKQVMLNQLLFEAVRANEQGIVRLLIAHGAEINPSDLPVRATPFARAASSMMASVIEWLVDEGAVAVGAEVLPFASEVTTPHTVPRLLKYGVDCGGPLLHDPVSMARFFNVKTLLEEAYVDVDARGENGKTALMEAARIRCEHPVPPLITQLLLDFGANVSLHDDRGRTALHHAVGSHHPQVVSLLLKAGADPNALDNSGALPYDSFNAVQSSAWHFVAPQIEALLEYGADPFLPGRDGMTLYNRLMAFDHGKLFVGAQFKFFRQRTRQDTD